PAAIGTGVYLSATELVCKCLLVGFSSFSAKSVMGGLRRKSLATAFAWVFACAATTGEEPKVPRWADEAIWYQIFPERFANGDPGNAPTRHSLESPRRVSESWAVTPWTSDWYSRAEWERQQRGGFYDSIFHRRYGGDLQGVLDRLDYLQELGVNAI